MPAEWTFSVDAYDESYNHLRAEDAGSFSVKRNSTMSCNATPEGVPDGGTITTYGTLLKLFPSDGDYIDVTAGNSDGDVRLYKTRYDAPGSDDRSNSSLNDEYVAIRNHDSHDVSLRGWTLRDAAGHQYTFGDVTLSPDTNLYVHTGSGDDDGRDVFWEQGNYVWNNDGDSAYLTNAAGDTRDTCSWRPLGGDGGLAYC